MEAHMETMQKTQTQPTTTEDLLTVMVTAAVNAREAKKAAEAAYAAAEADAILAMIDAGVATLTLADGTKVTAEGLDEVRRTIDIATLADLVTATTFDAVTERKVSLKAFDAARLTGDITIDVEAQVTTVKAVKPSLRVTAGK
jgi:hypothetical protein